MRECHQLQVGQAPVHLNLHQGIQPILVGQNRQLEVVDQEPSPTAQYERLLRRLSLGRRLRFQEMRSTGPAPLNADDILRHPRYYLPRGVLQPCSD